jgi:hypothetical protein
MSNVLDFAILSDQAVSQNFKERGCNTFAEAAEFIRQLPYARNKDKNNLITVFSDGCGTCGTKHALLKQLAIENGFEGLTLHIALFKMSAVTTPPVTAVLQKYDLEYIPEAHNYLKYNDHVADYTKVQWNTDLITDNLLEETEIEPAQIADYKVIYHKAYLQEWLAASPHVKMTLDELWTAREACIAALSA